MKSRTIPVRFSRPLDMVLLLLEEMVVGMVTVMMMVMMVMVVMADLLQVRLFLLLRPIPKAPPVRPVLREVAEVVVEVVMEDLRVPYLHLSLVGFRLRTRPKAFFEIPSQRFSKLSIRSIESARPLALLNRTSGIRIRSMVRTPQNSIPSLPSATFILPNACRTSPLMMTKFYS
jgi:hypothetical protein